MRGFVLVLSLCALTAGAQSRRVRAVEAVQAEDPCAHRTAGATTEVADVDTALQEIAAAFPSAAADPGRHTATVDPVKLAAGMAWEEAANEVLQLAEAIQELTPEQRSTLETIEQGKTAQQIFSGRLALLKMIATK